MKTYPLFLVNLDQRRCVVVGGGRVAARKVSSLRRADADVVVIAPKLGARLQQQVEAGDVHWLDRSYRSGDLEDAFLVIAATDDPDINERVWREAEERGLLVNVVDDPAHCNFIAPSVVRRGPLTVAISTSGCCPALSRHVRQTLEETFGPAYADYVTLLAELREETLDALSMDERRALWQEVFASDVLPLLASGEEEAACKLAREILSHHLPQGS